MDEFETDGYQDDAADVTDADSAVGEPGGVPPAAPAATAAFQEPAEPADFPVDYEHSGDRRVDDALDRLAELSRTPLPGHADVYDTVHTELRAILSEQPAGAQGPR